jgi:hypothetical protein
VLDRAAAGITKGQAVITPIEDLIKYVTTPHDHSLLSVKRNIL